MSPASRRSAAAWSPRPTTNTTVACIGISVDVVGAAQRVGDLVAGAARPADVEHDPQRVVAGHAHAADEPESTSAIPWIVSSFARATSIASSVSCSSCSPCRASWRRALSSEASSSDDGLVERSSRSARATAPASTRPLLPTWSIALWVSEPAILCVLVTIASAPCDSAVGGRLSLKPKCGPPRLVDDERHARAVGDLRASRRRRRPSRSRSARR